MTLALPPPKSSQIAVYRNYLDLSRCQEIIRLFESVSAKVSYGPKILMVHQPGLDAQEETKGMVAFSRGYFMDPSLREDSTTVMALREGGAQPLHADAEKQVDGVWQENHCPWRTHVALLYLNTSGEDYEGGVLNLPTQGVRIEPVAGLLVAFPATHEYVHEVTEVVNGVRYSLAVWMRND